MLMPRYLFYTNINFLLLICSISLIPMDHQGHGPEFCLLLVTSLDENLLSHFLYSTLYSTNHN
jgi:hypothetical protein